MHIFDTHFDKRKRVQAACGMPQDLLSEAADRFEEVRRTANLMACSLLVADSLLQLARCIYWP